MQKTQVLIIGAGPAGLMLAHILHVHGIESIVVEARSRDYALGRIRAGVLEQGTVDLLVNSGVGERLKNEGMLHECIDFAFNGARHRINVAELTEGRHVTVYGQTEIVNDLAEARDSYEGKTLFNSEVTHIQNSSKQGARATLVHNGKEETIACDFIAACDGFHGIGRQSFPENLLNTYDNEFPYSWFGILADAAPANEFVIYARHQDGFALASMRSPSTTRLYLQVENDENIDQWTDEDIWDALDKRLCSPADKPLNRGPILQRGVTPMRSFVAEPMSYQHVFLAGDAAHIVPPTGAKGLNLAMADVSVLSCAFINHFKRGDSELLKDYSRICLRRVWKVERFSWWCTSATHTNKHESEFEQRIHAADLDLLVSSETYARFFAENYTGLPVAHIPDF